MIELIQFPCIPFLLDDRPRFVNFDLFGRLGNFLYSGHQRMPAEHTRLLDWGSRMAKIKIAKKKP